MLVSEQQVRARIDQTKLSRDGFSRQLSHFNMSEERRMRLTTEVEVLSQELATLEKLMSILRVEPDLNRVETVVRDRLHVLREAEKTGTPGETDEDAHIPSSGEERALLWALGEDEISVGMRTVFGGGGNSKSDGAERALPGMLINNLQNSSDPDARASAAYELGLLHVVEAIVPLAAAANETGLLAEMAISALGRFTDDELEAAQLSPDMVARVRASGQ